MNSFNQIPAEWQYVIFGLAALIVGYLVVAIHKKVMEGRTWCISIANGCTSAGLTDLAKFFTELGTGDIIDAEKQARAWAVQMQTAEGRNKLLAKAIVDGAQYIASNDLQAATTILAILKSGAVSKSLFQAATASAATA